ncbi:MAG: hypothetical protein ACP5VS_14480 [Desulfomonilaceae bacterium]
MNDETWTIQKVRQEIYDARTKLFVVVKVLETGGVDLKQHEEWALVLRPLVKDILTYVDKLQNFIEES